jgi:hypothetical protein
VCDFKYTFVDKAHDDITIDDIPLLLEQYKHLAAIVINCDSEAQAAAATMATTPAKHRIVKLRQPEQPTYRALKLMPTCTYDELCQLAHAKLSKTSDVPLAIEQIRIVHLPNVLILDDADVELIPSHAELEVSFDQRSAN